MERHTYEPDDIGGPHWAGTVAVTTTFGPPVPAADLADGIEVPDSVRSTFGG